MTDATDVIVEVKDIPDVNFFKFAVRLEKYNSWILVEHLKESKADWELVEEIPSEEKEEDQKEGTELKEGQFMWQGDIYQISKIK